MANVKLSNKSRLEKLQAKLVLLKGKKVSQQDILDKCIDFTDDHFEQFLSEQMDEPGLNKEKIQLILSNVCDCKTYDNEKTDDELLYGAR